MGHSYRRKLAKTIERLFRKGNIDPTAEEIAVEQYHGMSPDDMAPGIIPEIEFHLKWIRNHLSITWGRRLVLYNVLYLSPLEANEWHPGGFRERGIQSEPEGAMCLCGGRHGGNGSRPVGIRFCDANDWLYLANERRNLNSGTGKMRKAITSLGENEVEPAIASEMMEAAYKATLPDGAHPARDLLSADLRRALGPEKK